MAGLPVLPLASRVTILHALTARTWAEDHAVGTFLRAAVRATRKHCARKLPTNLATTQLITM